MCMLTSTFDGRNDWVAYSIRKSQPFRFNVTNSSVYGSDLIFMQMLMTFNKVDDKQFSSMSDIRIRIFLFVVCRSLNQSDHFHFYPFSQTFYSYWVASDAARMLDGNAKLQNKPIKTQLVGKHLLSIFHGMHRNKSEIQFYPHPKSEIQHFT